MLALPNVFVVHAVGENWCVVAPDEDPLVPAVKTIAILSGETRAAARGQHELSGFSFFRQHEAAVDRRDRWAAAKP